LSSSIDKRDSCEECKIPESLEYCTGTCSLSMLHVKKWRHRFRFSGESSKKLKKSKTKSQSVGCLIESTTGSLFGNIDSFHGSWANLDSVSVTSNTSDDSRSLDSQDTCSMDRLHVPVQYSNDSGILHSSQESLLSIDDDKSGDSPENRNLCRHFFL
jgi:hypothetical protein